MIQTVMKVGTLEVEGYYNKWWGKYFTHYNVDQKDGSGAIIIFLTNVNVE